MTLALRLLALTALFAALTLGSNALRAQDRVPPLPANAKRATMSYMGDMMVSLDGRPMRLGPAVQVRNERNVLIVPSALPKESLVRYTGDTSGGIQRVWILSGAEAALPDKKE